MKRAVKVLKLIGSLLAVLITFVIGWADRFILVLMPWKDMPGITREIYFTKHFESSFLRVFAAGALIGISYLLKFLYSWFTE